MLCKFDFQINNKNKKKIMEMDKQLLEIQNEVRRIGNDKPKLESEKKNTSVIELVKDEDFSRHQQNKDDTIQKLNNMQV